MSLNQEIKDLVSVIIPVYNVEKFVAKCLNSIMNQTYKNLEIIVVNNNSKDNSWEIVSAIAQSDSRIILSECFDQGLSQTRNKGLDIFTGSWVTFVDSDDELTPDAIEAMLKKAYESNADIVSGPFALTDSSGNLIKKYTLEEMTSTDKEEFLIFSLTRFVNRSSVCGRLYKACLFQNHRFTPSLYGEDYPFLYSLLDDVKTYATIPDVVYLYRENSGSLTKATGISRQFEGAMATYTTAEQFEKYKVAQPYFFGSTFKIMMYLHGSTYPYRKEDKENWDKALKFTSAVAKKSKVDDFPSKVAKVLFGFSPQLTCFLFHVYYSMTYGSWAKSKDTSKDVSKRPSETKDRELSSSTDIGKDLVSVIIPVYNIEKYVGKCLESILNQTYKNLEIIIVDNNSTDNSYQAVLDTIEDDSRCQLIKCTTQGVSHARNAALDLAKGSYITFVDSDDMLTPDAIEKMLATARKNDADIVAGSIALVDADGCEIVRYPVKDYFSSDKEDFLVFSLTKFVNRSSVWGRLYKAALFEGNRFIPIHYCEDHDFLYRLMDRANCFATVSDVVYNYREFSNSVTKTSGISKQLTGAQAAYNTALSFEKYPDVQPYFFGCTFKILLYLLGSTYEYRKSDKENWQEAIKFSRQVAGKSKLCDFPGKIARLLIILCPHFVSFLLHIHYKRTYGSWVKE